jgi:hypothetical protein
MWLASHTDHYFTLIAGPSDAQRVQQLRPLDIQQAIERWLVRQGSPETKPELVIVAASGGGIQASAWTARVLVGLSQELGDKFRRSIRLISSVSGGSLGTMYFIESWFRYGLEHDGDPPGTEVNERAMSAASSSSLEASAWGMAYPDFMRILLPPLVPAELDRGWAIEQAWREALQALPPIRTPNTRGEALRDHTVSVLQRLADRLAGARIPDAGGVV